MKNVIQKINKQIDNIGDFNRVKKVNDRCWFMGCKGKVKFMKYDFNFMKQKSVILVCPICKTEHYKKLKEEVQKTKK